MNATTKLAAYALVLAAMAGAGAAIGAAAGPIDVGGGERMEHETPHTPDGQHDSPTSTTKGSGFGSHGH